MKARQTPGKVFVFVSSSLIVHFLVLKLISYFDTCFLFLFCLALALQFNLHCLLVELVSDEFGQRQNKPRRQVLAPLINFY